MVNVTTSYSPKIISFEGSLDLFLAGSRIFYFWQVLQFIHKFIIELHVLQCLFVKGSNKKQKRGRFISNFTKRETFSSLMTITCFWEKSHHVALLLAPFKNAFPLSFSLDKKRIYLDTQLKEQLPKLFSKLPGCSFFSRIGITKRSLFGKMNCKYVFSWV